jgi:hypothetical protein
MKHILNTEWKRNVNDKCSQLLMHINKPVRVPVVIMATDAHRFILLCAWPGSKSTWLQQSYGVTHCVLGIFRYCVGDVTHCVLGVIRYCVGDVIHCVLGVIRYCVSDVTQCVLGVICYCVGDVTHCVLGVIRYCVSMKNA